MKTVKVIYTGANKDGLVVGETLCQPGIPVDLPESLVRPRSVKMKLKEKDDSGKEVEVERDALVATGLLCRPDFKEAKEVSEPPIKPKA